MARTRPLKLIPARKVYAKKIGPKKPVSSIPYLPKSQNTFFMRTYMQVLSFFNLTKRQMKKTKPSPFFFSPFFGIAGGSVVGNFLQRLGLYKPAALAPVTNKEKRPATIKRNMRAIQPRALNSRPDVESEIKLRQFVMPNITTDGAQAEPDSQNGKNKDRLQDLPLNGGRIEIISTQELTKSKTAEGSKPEKFDDSFARWYLQLLIQEARAKADLLGSRILKYGPNRFWNGQKKAKYILGAIETLEQHLADKNNIIEDPNALLKTLESSDNAGKQTLHSALSWHRIRIFGSDSKPARSISHFEKLADYNHEAHIASRQN